MAGADEVLEVEVRLRDLISQQMNQLSGKVDSGFKKISDRAQRTANKTTNAFTKMKDSLKNFAVQFGPAALMVVGLTKALGKLSEAVDFVRERGVEFGSTMSKVEAIITGGPTPALQELSKEAKRLGETTAFSASEAGQAFVEMGKLGFTTNEILASTADVLNVAALSGTGLAESSEVMVKTLNQFTLEAKDAKRLTDVMAKSFTTTALDMDKFRESMKFVGTSARLAGLDVEQTTAILGIMADNGLEASTAGTSLNQMLIQMVKPGSKASKIFEKFGMANADVIEKMKFLAQAGIPVGEVFDLLDVRAGRAANVIFENIDALEGMAQGFREANGEADRMAKTMLDNVAGDMKILESASEGLALALGEAFGKSKRDRIQFYTTIVQKATTFVREHRGALQELAKNITAGIIKALKALERAFEFVRDNIDQIMILGKTFFMIWSGKKILALVGFFGKLKFSIAGVNKGLKLLAINPAILAIASASAAMDLIVNHFEKQTDKLNKLASIHDNAVDAAKLIPLRAEYEKILASGEKWVTTTNKWGRVVRDINPRLQEINSETRKIAGFTFDSEQGQRLTLRTLNTIVINSKELTKQKEAQAAKEKALADAEAKRLAQLQAEAMKAGLGGGITLPKEETEEEKKARLAKEREIKEVQRIMEQEHNAYLSETAEGRIQLLNEELEAKRALLDKHHKSTKELEGRVANEIQKIRDEEKKKADATAKQQLEARLKIRQAWIDTADTAISSTERVAGAIIKNEKKQKQIALVASIIQGALAIQKAVASAPPPANLPAIAATTATTLANTATIASQAFAQGGFPVGKNAMVRVNEQGQEAILNAGATARLGSGAINRLNAGRGDTTVSNEISYSPTINLGSESTGQDVLNVLREDKESFANFVRDDIFGRGYLKLNVFGTGVVGAGIA